MVCGCDEAAVGACSGAGFVLRKEYTKMKLVQDTARSAV